MNTLLEANSNVWFANLVSSAVVIAILGYFLKRYITTNDQRIAEVEEESKEIKKNYLRRFEIVNENIYKTKDEIVNKVSDRLDRIEKDKTDYRIRQSEATGRIESELRNLSQFCRDTIKRQQ